MIQLLYPIGLFAIAAIIIPVIIHLWNIKQGKTLKIGSIALLGESSRQSSKSYRITDWLLFILRCLLLIIIAFLIAQPILKTEIGAGKDNGWIVVESNNLKSVYKNQKKTIDSLLDKDYELHDLNVGFAKLNLSDTAKILPDTLGISYFSFVKQLNSLLPPGFKVYMFAENRLNRFSGEIPRVSIDLKWKTFTADDSTKTWISKAFYTNKDSIRTFLTHSGSKRSYVEIFNLTDQTAKTKQIEIRTDSGKTELKSKDQPNWIPADTASINVSIYENGSKNDALYVESAILSIREFTQMKINTRVVRSVSAISPAADIVFWLSADPGADLLSAKLKSGATMFTYQPGKEESVSSVLDLNPNAGSSLNPPKLYKRVIADMPDREILWSDGFGDPLLVKDQSLKLTRYHFYSHFDPQYSDLVWNDSFAKALMPIIVPSDEKYENFGFEDNQLDRRQIAYTEPWIHQTSFSLGNSDTKIYTNTSLTNILWFIALLIFTAERIVSFRKSK